MKFATVCETHLCVNGGTKHQVFLAKELVKRGHQFTFYLRDTCRPPWALTEGIEYKHKTQVAQDKGDVLIANWYLVNDIFNNEEVVKNWNKRILIIHDTPTANNCNGCLEGNHWIMGVSPTMLSIATGLHQVHDRVLPLYVHCGASKEFNCFDRQASEDSNILTIGIVGDNGERNVWFRGIQTCQQILEKIKNINKNIRIHIFTANNEHDMAKNYKQCHFLFELPYLAGCPTCVVESMACGTPVITTYYGTTHIVFNGFNGFVMPKGNVDYCAEYLCDKLTLENFIYMKNNIHVEDFSWEKLADKFLKNLEYIK